MTRLIIDGDYLIYAGACAAEKHYYRYYQEDGEKVTFDYKKEALAYIKDSGKAGQLKKVTGYKAPGLARSYTKSALEKVFKKYPGASYKLYLTSSDKSNYRYRAGKTLPYKANRPSRPRYYDICKEYLCAHFHPIVVSNCEADDIVAIMGTANPQAIIVHVDKDIDQVPGLHYNPNKDEEYIIDERTAVYNLYAQILGGDKAVDNVPGLKHFLPPRIAGPKKIEALFADCEREQDFQSVMRKFVLQNSDLTDIEYDEKFLEMKHLVYLPRTKEELEQIRGKYESI